MKMSQEEALDAMKTFAGKDIEDVMGNFYGDFALKPSEVLPWQIAQMYALIVRTANAFAITREEARDLIRLTIDLAKADSTHVLMDEMGGEIDRIHETLKEYGEYLEYLANIGG